MSEHGIESLLPKKGMKLGKHSVWLYGGLIGAAILAFMYFERSKSGDTTDDTTDTDGALPETSGTGLTSGGGESDGGGVDSVSSGTGTDSGITILYTDDSTQSANEKIVTKDLNVGGVETTTKNNNAWEKAAVGFLTSVGVGGANAQKAIQKYLSGDHLTYHQHILVNHAIKNVGLNPKHVATASFTTKAQAKHAANVKAKAKQAKKTSKPKATTKPKATKKAASASKPKKTIKVKKKAKK